ncbi:PTS system IIA component, mannose/fructose/sorbose (Man) family [Hyphomonas neptunium ATCC 15444]|uniref:PTS system IIA component, mannose/fructose/sorbose (Man) family n=1 Tax=Hyphomonas neptunium (strain ATCC 15444) TaxID=228405 RepID=Q0C525_HYPNA|nr:MULTISPECIES: PTS fructose transporter subunit IIA [Hyphomonas]ABI77111.1 PTS system IIA component, mannose/fructose/sorbose (Man) family [Hyphomonas neptunium ATCC 15444]
MIGIVVVSHGRLAHELVAAAEHVVGRLWRARAVSIDSDDDLDLKREHILAAVKACDAGRGVIVLTDMFGGTPSNLVLSIRGSVPMEIVSGANLPMLIKLAEVREVLSLEEAAIAAAEGGRKYVTIASELLARLP